MKPVDCAKALEATRTIASARLLIRIAHRLNALNRSVGRVDEPPIRLAGAQRRIETQLADVSAAVDLPFVDQPVAVRILLRANNLTFVLILVPVGDAVSPR